MEQAAHGRQGDMDVQVYSDHDTEVEPAQEHRAMKKKITVVERKARSLKLRQPSATQRDFDI